MTNTNCKNCDQPECEAEARKAAMFADDDATDDTFNAWMAADAICYVNAVDWRARALTEAARADSAEAKAAYWPHAAMVAHTLRGRIMALDVAMQTIRGAELTERQLQALALVDRALAELQAEADRVAAMCGEP